MLDRDLLWKAWPSGYLAMRGVSTVAGWTCYRVDRDGVAFWVHPKKRRDERRRVVPDERSIWGVDLLPNVNPADIATWACLLADLADAVNEYVRGDGTLFFQRDTDGDWMLGTVHPGNVEFDSRPQEIHGHHYFKGLDTDDPALALVLARIREAEGA